MPCSPRWEARRPAEGATGRSRRVTRMARRSWVLTAVLAAALVVVVVLVVLRASASAPGRCSDPVRDPLDPRSLQHPLAGVPPSYATEPPTSGPHQAGRHPGGAVAEPLPGPVQVGALEAGQVLLQHRDLAPAERSRLEAFGGSLVIVAPNRALPTKVAASAWRTRQLCPRVDEEALRRFIEVHAGRFAQHPG